jgi:SAM-dependent methyltransferase
MVPPLDDAAPPAAAFPLGEPLPLDVVAYGPDIPDEASLRLLGNVDGRRLVLLGAGRGQAVVALARQGAHVIVVEPDADTLDGTRQLCEAEEVRVELHVADLAELAFIRADTVDLALSVMALGGLDDLDRVFRQVHRVLRPEAPLVASLPHPAMAVAEGRSYFDRTPQPWEADGQAGTVHPRTVGDVLTSVTRANFRIDALLEPEVLDRPGPSGRSRFWQDRMASVPATMILRAKKLGT